MEKAQGLLSRCLELRDCRGLDDEVREVVGISSSSSSSTGDGMPPLLLLLHCEQCHEKTVVEVSGG